jgi:hypothetical protein
MIFPVSCHLALRAEWEDCFVLLCSRSNQGWAIGKIEVCGILAKNRFDAARDGFKLPDITKDRTVTIATPLRAIRQFEI